MAIVDGSIEIEAPVETVWRFITQHENFGKYIPSYHGGDIVSQIRVGPGTTYRWYTVFLGFRITTLETVVQWVENSRVRYEGETAGAPFRSEMHTQAIQTGTRFVARIEYQVPWLLGHLLDRLLIRPRVESEVRTALKNVKEMLEGGINGKYRKGG